MSSIDRINRINQQELESNVSDAASWHRDYKDTLYIFIGNLNKKLKEKDVLIIFSQYGIPTHIKMIKDDDGSCKGWCYLKYESFNSCVLAVDNFNGVVVYDQKLRVDHCWFKLRDGETEEQYLVDYDTLVPKNKELEWKDGRKKDKKTKLLTHKEMVNESDSNDFKDQDDFKDPMDDFRDPMDDFKDPMDDFKDPMDDFKDPMDDFKDDLKPKKEGSRHSKH